MEDETLRMALKENGIGRPSSRASIIETLFKRHYIKRERKNLVATPTGIELIGVIREELLKSCELTGIWEKKLRDIEHQKYDASQFVNELKEQIKQIVDDVMRDGSNRRVAVTSEEDLKKKRKGTADATDAPKKKAVSRKKTSSAGTIEVGMVCPLCGKGTVIRGNTQYGCSRWKEGCTWRHAINED